MNQQPIEKMDHSDGSSLDIVATWDTIQGEGPLAGKPARFIRTAGCNLQCPFCDTEYTTGRCRVTVEDLLDRFKDKPRKTLFVITGGEPMRQPITPLVRKLLMKGQVVQIETNGTLFRPDLPYLDMDFWVVCSPKTGKVSEELSIHIRAWKYIVEAGQVDPEDGLPLSSLGMGVRVARPPVGALGEVYVQPMDSSDPAKNKLNTEAAVASCMRFGYRLCLQVHKIVGLD